MSEQNNNLMDQNEFMKRMKAIASDLWGGVMPVATETPAAPAQQSKPAPRPQEKPGTDIRNLWKTADETIDWTDALSHSTPTDGLTGPKMWAFYHKHAEKVLAGDLNAYTEVLQKANPLGELTEYAEGISMRAPSGAHWKAYSSAKRNSWRRTGSCTCPRWDCGLPGTCWPACRWRKCGDGET